MRAPGYATLLAVLCAATACSETRSPQGPTTNRVSWQEDVAPVFAARCSPCHSGSTAQHGYQTTSYLAAIGKPDAPEAVAGDPNSNLLRVLGDIPHQPVADTLPLVRSWVVDGQLSFFRSVYHRGGILNPRDPNGEFHGNLAQGIGWKLDTCGQCHGADFQGGSSGVSCTQCHAQGPTSCDTCHGQPPANGAHLAHAGGRFARQLDCSECHTKPAHWDDPGHLTDANGKAKTKANVVFADNSEAKSNGAQPQYNGTTCGNTYCHGGTLTTAGGKDTSPSWVNGQTATCESCHAMPPADHSKFGNNPNCSACHSATAPTPTTFNKATHVDGIVQIGNGTTPVSCTSCHGSASAGNAAPPRDLSGNTSTSAIGVGAHQAHLLATSNLSGPVACSACHVVPAAIDSPGHMDSPGPAEVSFHDLANTDGAQSSWNRTDQTCGTYCHGGGAALSADKNAALQKPIWTLGPSQAYCGSCHGLPPSTPSHAGVSYPDCARCHAQTVTANGGIIVNGTGAQRTSKHINGVIDVVTTP